MLEDYDPHLSRFIGDLGVLLGTIVQAIEILIGIVYFIGGKSVEGLKGIYSTGHEGYSQLYIFADTVHNEFIEFVSSAVRAVLLIFYGIQKIIDSFYITAIDIANFCVHFKESISQTVAQCYSFIFQDISRGILTVPEQIVEALSLVWQAFSYFVVEVIGSYCLDFLIQIFVSPIRVILLVSRTLVRSILLPVQFVLKLPTSSLLGLCVIILYVLAFRRILRHFVLRNILGSLTALLALLTAMLSYLRLPYLKNLIISWIQNQRTSRLHERDSFDTGNDYKVRCVVCYSAEVQYMACPCKHLCLCNICVNDLINRKDNLCPLCRNIVFKYDRVFIP